jgi:hypothetical protein
VSFSCAARFKMKVWVGHLTDGGSVNLTGIAGGFGTAIDLPVTLNAQYRLNCKGGVSWGQSQFPLKRSSALTPTA